MLYDVTLHDSHPTAVVARTPLRLKLALTPPSCISYYSLLDHTSSSLLETLTNVDFAFSI